MLYQLPYSSEILHLLNTINRRMIGDAQLLWRAVINVHYINPLNIEMFVPGIPRGNESTIVLLFNVYKFSVKL